MRFSHWVTWVDEGYEIMETLSLNNQQNEWMVDGNPNATGFFSKVTQNF